MTARALRNSAPAAKDYVALCNWYAEEVVAERIDANQWIKLAAKRHLDDLAKSRSDKSYPYWFSKSAAHDVCEFIEKLPHVKGRWAREKKRIVLEAWQCFLLCVGFGWLKRKNGLRRFRKFFWLIPRKNGKSILAAAIGLYMWCMDGEVGAEVYTGATTEKQAWEVFRPAKLMLEQSKSLLDFVGKDAVHFKSLVVEKDYSRFEPLIGKPGDGSSPSCAIADEYHEHDTPDLVDTMETGMLAREQPISLKISTAGVNLAGPCRDEFLEAQKVLLGVLENEELFCAMWGIDETEYQWNGHAVPPDDWANPKVLRKANPNFGISVDADSLEADHRQAVLDPAKQNRFKTKHLNVWCSARTAWMSLPVWNFCGDSSLSIDEFKGSPAYFILDLASKDDIAAFSILIRKKLDGVMHFYTFAKYYVPESALEDENNPNAAVYRKWKAQGWLTVTDGAEIDFDTIRDDVLKLKNHFQVKEIVYDPWRATQLAQQLAKAGATVVEFRQTVQNLSAPMKETASAVKGNRLHHDNNPMTTWMVSNVTAKADAKDNIYPRKEKPQYKIDGAVALIMGVARAMLDPSTGIERWLKDPVVPASSKKATA